VQKINHSVISNFNHFRQR